MKLKFSLLSAALFSSTLLLNPSVSVAKLPVAIDGQTLPTLAPMLERVTPGVVSIQVSGAKEVRRRVDPFDYFFGQPKPRSQKRQFSGLGSGVIIDASEGYVVTNNHVIADAEKIIVTLEDGREFDAKLVGTDKESDIALLEIESDDLTEVKLANSDALRVGDFAVAIGNPFGLSHTVTSGIVSALGRSGLNIEGYEDFIQTDAAINQGNSGGALVNLRGELIGINTAILGASGGNVGIGFAIPSNMMKSLVDQIVEFGQVRRGSLGIQGRTLDAGIAKAQGFDVKQGAYVAQVVKDSAASEAGIQANDVIVSVNGDDIQSFAELASKIATIGEGRTVKVGVYREGKVRTIKVTLKGQAELQAQADKVHPMLRGAVLESGERNGNKGVVVSSVEARSPAARVGLEEGDVIMQVNRQRIDSIREMSSLIEDIQGNIVLGVKRGRDSVFLLIQ
ncbi:serine endoprotease DegQ [Pseudoalteromonas citrea]|uniref:Serine endoprotease DegQ n=2 Tax=Pseudoalteromonas TaxID=53246 RepID=A0A5S3V7I6_9GAMM|nr:MULTISPECIES: DegQ family serine endoprotease [Pseudoalteromonas]RJE76861.1 serine endoprotease DegQ [Pseudoalteromonas sp. MSK9-3]TMO64082.1 serine endoprotease DegQ [Pseudoalteromonas aurantia]TMO66848.1 serine endoprotease DegQ [Pseudoalteromonas aurantia]TMO78711.1 serine endoprotease DegQ [Pseudoalteromonas aurantia]TMP45632.1 serine endoprotease DegQ [Pseudoalteromonas citrea]